MKNLKLSIPKTLNLLVYLFPLSFILGNFFINITIFFFCILGIIHYKKKPFIFNKNNPLSLIIIFFVTVLISTSLEYLVNEIGTDYLIKALVFLRYLIFLIILRYMVLNNDLNLKKTLLASLLFSSFVACDVIFQYFVGLDIFGNKPWGGFYSGVFGNEAVAGGYIQKFAVIGFFSLPLVLNNKNPKFIYIAFILLAICFLGTLFSNNRIPTIMFCFFLFALGMFLLLKKSDIKNGILIFLSIFVFVWWASSVDKIKTRYKSFYAGIPQFSEMVEEIKNKHPEFKKYKNTGTYFFHTETFKKNEDKIKILPNFTGHTQLYITSIEIFTENVLMGRGIKSFRHTCAEKIHLPNRTCGNHPHHFYLEILNDVGIFGFIIIFSGIVLLMIKNYEKYYKKKGRFNTVFSLTFYALFTSLVIEFFPIRSQGSFFSVWNASYIFFLLGISCGLYDLKAKKSAKKIFNF